MVIVIALVIVIVIVIIVIIVIIIVLVPIVVAILDPIGLVILLLLLSLLYQKSYLKLAFFIPFFPGNPLPILRQKRTTTTTATKTRRKTRSLPRHPPPYQRFLPLPSKKIPLSSLSSFFLFFPLGRGRRNGKNSKRMFGGDVGGVDCVWCD